MEKTLRRILVILPCLLVCCGLILAVPASAATSHIYDIEDYRYYTTYTSTTQTDYYGLSNLTSYGVLPTGGSWTEQTGESYTYTVSDSGLKGFSFCYGGVSGGVALDSLPTVGLTSATYKFGVTVMNNGSSTRSFTWRAYLYCWDSSLASLGYVNLGDPSTVSLSGNGNYTYFEWTGSSLPVLPGTAYYLMGFGLYWYASAGDSVSVDLGGLETNTGGCSYRVETTRNSQAISDGKLDEIKDALNSSSGGASSDFVDKVGDQSDQLDHIAGEIDSVDRPDPGDINVSIDNYVTSDDMGQVSSILAALFSSQLFSGYLMILLIMATVAYALFGKRG